MDIHFTTQKPSQNPNPNWNASAPTIKCFADAVDARVFRFEEWPNYPILAFEPSEALYEVEELQIKMQLSELKLNESPSQEEEELDKFIERIKDRRESEGYHKYIETVID